MNGSLPRMDLCSHYRYRTWQKLMAQIGVKQHDQRHRSHGKKMCLAKELHIVPRLISHVGTCKSKNGPYYTVATHMQKPTISLQWNPNEMSGIPTLRVSSQKSDPKATLPSPISTAPCALQSGYLSTLRNQQHSTRAKGPLSLYCKRLCRQAICLAALQEAMSVMSPVMSFQYSS